MRTDPLKRRLLRKERCVAEAPYALARGRIRPDNANRSFIMSVRVIVAIVLLRALCLTTTYPTAAFAQAAAKDEGRIIVQPDEAHFGTVRQNAIVEGSVLVMIPGDSVEGLVHEVLPPAFATVRNVTLGTHTYGEKGSRVRCHVTMAFDTSQVRNLAGFLKVRLGDERVTIRMTLAVTAEKEGVTHLLVVDTPFHGTATGDWRMFDAWKQVVEDGNLSPNYLEVESGKSVLGDLKMAEFEVILIDGGGLVSASDDDLKRLHEFVGQGGRLVVAASHFMQGSVEKANKLFAPFGFLMRNTEVRMEKNLVDFEKNDITFDELTNGVKNLRIHRPTPMNIVDRESAGELVCGQFYDEGFVVVAARGEGQLIGLGVPLWWKWIGGEGAGPDNARMLRNILTRPRDRNNVPEAAPQ